MQLLVSKFRFLVSVTIEPGHSTLLFVTTNCMIQGNPRKFGDSGSTEQNTTNEPKLMKKRGDTKLSAAVLGKHFTIYKWPRNSCVVLKSLFSNRKWSAGVHLAL